MSRQSLLKLSLKIAVSMGIIAILVINLKPEHLAQAFKTLSMVQVMLALGIYLFCQLISAVKWHQLAKSINLHGTMLLFYEFYLMGMFFGLFLPTAIGGDVGRALLLSKHTDTKWTRAFLSILAERATGLLGLLVYVLMSVLMFPKSQWVYSIFTIIMLVTSVAVMGVFGFPWIERHPWGHRFIQKFVLKNVENQEEGQIIWPPPRAIAVGILISLLFHGLSISLQWFVLKEMGVTLPFFTLSAIYGLAGVSSMLPISLGGIGVREGTATYLLMTWGHVPQYLAVGFSLVWLAILLLSTLPGGILTLMQQFRIPLRKNV